MNNIITSLSNNSSNSLPSLSSLRKAHSDLLNRHREISKAQKGEMENSDDNLPEEFTIEIKEFIKIGQAIGRQLNIYEDRRTAQSLLDYWANVLLGAGKKTPDTTLAKFDPDALPSLKDGECPYVGLNPFRETDYNLFHGRKHFVDSLIDHLRQNNLLAVVGTFASGKSSVVFGGLLPRLMNGALLNSEDWSYPKMCPGSEPLANLEKVLRESNDEQRKNKSKVLTIDHFEEIFTLCEANEVRAKFIDRLLELVQSENPRNIVILIVQDIQVPEILELKTFGSKFSQARFDMPMLSLQELRDAIEEPAKSIDLRIDKKLIDTLLEELVRDPFALPLLQFTMLKLWSKRDKNQIHLEAYEQLVKDAYKTLECPPKPYDKRTHKILAADAEKFYQDLSKKDKRKTEIAEDILKQLFKPVRESDTEGGRVATKKLYQRGKQEERAQITQVLEDLIKSQLLRKIGDISSDDGQVEVAHPSLKDDWRKLQRWLINHRFAQQILDNLADDVIPKWKKTKGVHLLILSSEMLSWIDDYVNSYDDVKLNEDEKEYIDANRDKLREEEKEKNILKFRAIIQALVAHARLQQAGPFHSQRSLKMLKFQASSNGSNDYAFAPARPFCCC